MKRLWIGLISLFFVAGPRLARANHQGEWVDQPESSDDYILPAGAVEKVLVRIISEPENNLVHKLILVMKADGEIIQLVRKSASSIQVFTPEELIQGEVVLATVQGRKAVILSCKGCEKSQGGNLKLSYLFNGVTMTYRSLSMRFVRDGADWLLYTQNMKPIRRLKLVSRIVFGQIIGIKRIDVL